MIRVIAIALRLSKLRETNPALLDGSQALAAINACIVEYAAEYAQARTPEASAQNASR
jgi:hypothetical protein